jgi:hypothetical protein
MQAYGRFAKIGVAAAAMISVGLWVYYFLHERPPGPPLPTATPAAQNPLGPPGKPAAEEKASPFVILPKLAESDDWLRQKAKDLSPSARLAKWLKMDDLIRRITAAVDNIAEGKSPRPHLKFLAPEKPFTVIEKQKVFFLNPQSYRRYDLLADAFSSLNAAGTVRMFRDLKPLFQEAYKELGYPEQDFEKTLVRAMKELLAVPVVQGDIAMEQQVITYGIMDEDLEDLSEAQKHLLRMGPRNIRKIQNQLRELASALGVPEKQLPKSMAYASHEYKPAQGALRK